MAALAIYNVISLSTSLIFCFVFLLRFQNSCTILPWQQFHKLRLQTKTHLIENVFHYSMRDVFFSFFSLFASHEHLLFVWNVVQMLFKSALIFQMVKKFPISFIHSENGQSTFPKCKPPSVVNFSCVNQKHSLSLNQSNCNILQ